MIRWEIIITRNLKNDIREIPKTNNKNNNSNNSNNNSTTTHNTTNANDNNKNRRKHNRQKDEDECQQNSSQLVIYDSMRKQNTSNEIEKYENWLDKVIFEIHFGKIGEIKFPKSHSEIFWRNFFYGKFENDDRNRAYVCK